MSCPFYGVSLFVLPGGPVLVPTPGNRCALITSAHSPCWMEIGENAAPDWETCPRNPAFFIADDAAFARASSHDDWMTANHGRLRTKPESEATQ